MAMLRCKECGKQFGDRARRCPDCAAPVPQSKRWLWVSAMLLTMLAVIILVEAQSPASTAMAQAQAAIDSCWQAQQRKSLGPEEQRYVAKACETMEERFFERFGSRR
jgi:hypothetical protein